MLLVRDRKKERSQDNHFVRSATATMGQSPGSSNAMKAAFDAAVKEFLRRVNAGERVDVAAFIAAFPQIADKLRDYFAKSDVLKHWGEKIVVPDASATLTVATSHGSTELETVPPNEPVVSAGSTIDRTGQTFGRYRINRILGQGAMGVVYLAHDTQLERDVALKVPKFDQHESPELIERFYREARSAAALQHRNICPLYDIGENDGTRYITLAYIEGRPLAQFISPSRPQPLRWIAGVVRKLAIALAAAHERGVIHRDLKPANILIDTHKEPVIMDFGLARQINKVDEARITQSGALVGSPAYMSPEQVECKLDEIGPGSDIYSLGVILYELLTGQLPFQGSIGLVIGQIVAVNPPKPSTRRAEIDPALEAICLKMMAKRIDNRYASMTEVADALTAYFKSPAPSSGTISTSQVAKPSAPSDSTVLNARSKKTFARADCEALLRAAKECVQAHEYEQGLEILSQIPQEQVTDEVRDLRESTQSLQDELDLLLADIETSRRRRSQIGMMEKIDRLAELQPAHPYVRQSQARSPAHLRTIKAGGPFDPRRLTKSAVAVLAVGIGGLLVGGTALYYGLREALSSFDAEADSAIAAISPEISSEKTSDKTQASVPVAVTAEKEPEERVPDEQIKPAESPISLRHAETPSTLSDVAEAPFDETTAKRVQQSTATRHGAPVEMTNTIGMKLVLIPAGEFTMGTQAGEINKVRALGGLHTPGYVRREQPAIRVRLANAFYLGMHEVTRGEFAKFVEWTNFKTDAERDGKGAAQSFTERNGVSAGKSIDWRSPGYQQTERDPVVNVSVNDAMAFCEWLSTVEGRTYRLPREAEWEFACRAGTETIFYAGDDRWRVPQVVNTNLAGDGFPATAPVGSFPPNPFGLCDMLGNVWEICQDYGTENYSGHNEAGEAPSSANRQQGVVRGGAGDCPAAYCRSAVRSTALRTGREANVGFRVLCEMPAK